MNTNNPTHPTNDVQALWSAIISLDQQMEAMERRGKDAPIIGEKLAAACAKLRAIAPDRMAALERSLESSHSISLLY